MTLGVRLAHWIEATDGSERVRSFSARGSRSIRSVESIRIVGLVGGLRGLVGLASIVGAPIVIAGCHGTLFELPAGDLDGGTVADLGTPDLGRAAPTVFFVPTVQDDLDAQSCSALDACHGGSAPMRLVPRPKGDGAALRANFTQVRERAMLDVKSPLLVKTLQGSGVGHVGPQPFTNASDPTYQRWLEWIRGGVPFAPDAGVP